MLNLSSSIPQVSAEDIVSFLKQKQGYKAIYRQLIVSKIITQTAQAKGVSVTSAEIQAEANKIRYQYRLEKASDTLRWLKDSMITEQDWEDGIIMTLLACKLANFLFSQEAKHFFQQNKLDFEKIIFYQIILPNQAFAQELFYRITEEEISFYEAAHLYDIDEKRRLCCGYEGKFDRWSLNPEVSALLFAHPVGQVLGPLKTNQGFHLFKVTEIISAEFCQNTKQKIIDKLFKDWLDRELNYYLYQK